MKLGIAIESELRTRARVSVGIPNVSQVQPFRLRHIPYTDMGEG